MLIAAFQTLREDVTARFSSWERQQWHLPMSTSYTKARTAVGKGNNGAHQCLLHRERGSIGKGAPTGKARSAVGKGRKGTHHCLLQPEAVSHLLPVLNQNDVLQALEQGRRNGLVPQLVELVPGDRV